MAESPLTDAELIARVVVRDDRHAFSELVRRHQSAVRTTLRRLAAGNHALADDLAQETFMLAYRNLGSFRQEAKFSTWLYRIATNAYLADARKRKEELLGDRDADLADEDAGDSDGAGGADPARAATLSMDMQRAMAVLSDAERAAIVQCYHNDLSHEEAAQVLNCPVGTVKTHILRAKQKLKSRLAAWAQIDETEMNDRPTAISSADDDWLDAALRAEGREHRAGYLDDDGFTSRVMATLPAPAVLPAWRRPALTALWAAAGLGIAVALPGTVIDVAHDLMRVIVGQRVSLAGIGAGLMALGVATWAAAAVALRND